TKELANPDAFFVFSEAILIIRPFYRFIVLGDILLKPECVARSNTVRLINNGIDLCKEKKPM
ncbi:5733_t:CDS:1, partial [Racocetra persica]